MNPMRKRFFSGVVLVAGVFVWVLVFHEPAEKPNPLPESPAETIPSGIVVTETTAIVPPPSQSGGGAPGDHSLMDYAKSGTPRNDLQILSNTLTNFLTVSKQSGNRPLSANEEWSAALRGMRPGAETWISEGNRILDSQKRLIDRWGTPLHFHALGSQKWEIRSAGPDRKIWTEDDLMEPLPGSSATR